MRIALSGHSGAGKTEVANHLRAAHGFAVCHTGRFIRDLCLDLFGTEAKATTNQLSDALNRIRCGSVLRAALKRVPGDPLLLVVDSIRFHEDYALARSEGMVVLRIDAPGPLRLARLASRGQIYDPQHDELHATEVELDSAAFDASLINDCPDLAALRTRVDAVLARLR